MKSIAYKEILAISIWAAILSACTKVDFCYEDMHPHTSNVSLSYTWENDLLFDSMIVVAYRPVNSWSCGYMYNPHRGNGKYIYNRPDTLPLADGSEPLYTPSGEYRFLTYNYSPKNETYTYGNVNDTTSVASGNYIQYKRYTLANLPVADNIKEGWQNVNKYSGYVLEGKDDFYYDVTDITKINEKNETVEFAPQGLMKNIELHFSIVSDDAVIESVVGELSGIPSSYNILRNTFNKTTTHKVLFAVKSEGAGRYVANISILGLIPNKSALSLSGNSVLQLAIKCKEHKKAKVARMNITNLIYSLPEVMEPGKDSYLFEINAPITIENGELLFPSLDNEVSSWFEYVY